ncbi:MAG: GNAT family N-acetyltransferase [Candidatus Heimdallarchaeota archaeon]
MAKTITYTTKNYAEIELAELAKLSVDIWNAKGNQYTVEGFTNWLKNLEYTIEPQIIQARRDTQLVGWVMLFAHSKTELELNPFALGGLPIIEPNENFEMIADHLLKEAIEYFDQSKYTRIELLFNKEGSEEERIYKRIYTSNKFELIEQICHMRIDLTNYQHQREKREIEFKPISQFNDDDFYNCLYSTFKDTEDKWMLSLSDEEIKDHFEKRILNISFKLIEECSLGIIEDNKLIAFSVVRESHGQQNGNLWILGVHPSHRRQGIATFLIDTMLNKLAENDYKTASLNVDLTNKPAYNLYKAKGFKEGWVKLAYVLKKEE